MYPTEYFIVPFKVLFYEDFPPTSTREKCALEDVFPLGCIETTRTYSIVIYTYFPAFFGVVAQIFVWLSLGGMWLIPERCTGDFLDSSFNNSNSNWAKTPV